MYNAIVSTISEITTMKEVMKH